MCVRILIKCSAHEQRTVTKWRATEFFRMNSNSCVLIPFTSMDGRWSPNGRRKESEEFGLARAHSFGWTDISVKVNHFSRVIERLVCGIVFFHLRQRQVVGHHATCHSAMLGRVQLLERIQAIWGHACIYFGTDQYCCKSLSLCSRDRLAYLRNSAF